jgi:hypothetical protein
MKIVKVISAVLVIAILFFGLFEGESYRTGVLYGLFGFLAVIIAYPFIRRYYFHQMMTNLNLKFKVDRYVEDDAFLRNLIESIDAIPYTPAGDNLRNYAKKDYPRFEELNAILTRLEKLRAQKQR